MAVIVLSVVPLIFQGIEKFVFNFPSGAASNDEDVDIFLIDRDIGDPTGMKVFFAGIHDGVIKKINVIGPGGSV